MPENSDQTSQVRSDPPRYVVDWYFVARHAFSLMPILAIALVGVLITVGFVVSLIRALLGI